MDSKSSFMVLIGRVRRVSSLNEIHVNVQCAIVLYVLHTKHKHCKVDCHLCTRCYM